jgi:hypothetical protein
VNGKITSRADERFSRPGAQFLLDFAATLRGYGVKDSNVLLDAVDKLASAKLSYRGFIQHRIRPHLDRLTPDSLDKYVRDQVDSPEALRDALRKLYSLTLGELSAAIASVASEPNAVAYALIEEFVDRVIRSEDVADTWYEFYTYERFNIWPSEFHALGERSRLRTEWSNALARIEKEIGLLEEGIIS